MLLVILKAKILIEHFTKQNYKKKKNQKEFRIEKDVQWKSYGNSFNSWIDKKDMNINE